LPLEKVDLFNFDVEEPDTVNVKGYQCYTISSKSFTGYDNSVLQKRTWTSVKHKWNRCCGKNFYSERAEIFTKKKRAKNKEIWYGFKIRFPKDFKDIDDRLLISQFMNEFKNMKKSPLMGIHLYWAGGKLVMGGDTGGKATVSWNSSDHYKFKVQNSYFKKSNQWKTFSIKRRDNDEFKIYKCEISKNNTVSVLPDYCNKYKSNEFNATPKGEWSTFKIGIKNSNKKDGFMKVYKCTQVKPGHR